MTPATDNIAPASNGAKVPDVLPSAVGMQINIGQYARLAGTTAKAWYGFDRALLSIVTAPTADSGAAVLEQIVLQLIHRLPTHAARVYLYEHSASAQFAEIKHLFAATQGALGCQWFATRDAVRSMHELNQEVISRASLLAGARQATIYSFNANRRVPKVIQLVVLKNLAALVAQDAQVLQIVRHLADKGPACGVIPVLLHNLEETRALGVPPQQIKAVYDMLGVLAPCALGFNFTAALPPYGTGEPYQKYLADFGYRPHFAPDVAASLGARILNARVQQAEKNPHQDFLNIKIGEANAKPAHFSLGHAINAFNALVSGGSNSGKTTFLQNLILSICEHYTPEQIQLILLDYGTVSFGPYRRVAHVQSVLDEPTNGMQLYHLFEFLTQELHRRKDAFKACGKQHDLTVDNLRTYKKLSGIALPPIVLVIDEFGSLMNKDNLTAAHFGDRAVRISIQAEQSINLLVREGRKVGLHIILITQSFAEVDRMPQDFKSNPHVAVGLKAETVRDSRALLNSENDAAHHLERYQAVLNAKAGQPGGNLIVDLEHITEEAIAERQQSIREKWPKMQDSPLERHFKNTQTLPSSSQKSMEVMSSDSNARPSWLRGAPTGE